MNEAVRTGRVKEELLGRELVVATTARVASVSGFEARKKRQAQGGICPHVT
jgi:hypothetical protein